MEEQFINKLKAYLSELPEINAAFIYGSFARGNENDHSDVDIAILTKEHRLGIDQKLRMIDELERICHRQVDLVTLTEVSSILKNQVLKNGELLVCKDRKALNHFRVRSILEYLDLKQTRLPIEEHLKQVSIYG
ncbi:nucleotidyltransferase domain-containing protein [bacterium]|nr:nucleotidyltransferase domain-containing protein [bacterium]